MMAHENFIKHYSLHDDTGGVYLVYRNMVLNDDAGEVYLILLCPMTVQEFF